LRGLADVEGVTEIRIEPLTTPSPAVPTTKAAGDIETRLDHPPKIPVAPTEATPPTIQITTPLAWIPTAGKIG
jgi:hypothetical protein